MSQLINNNCFFSIQSKPTNVFMDASICQMRVTVDKVRGVLEIITITVHQPISMNPFISITRDTAFLNPGMLFVLNMLLSESAFESSIPFYRQAQCPQRQPQYRCPQPQYNKPKPNTHYSRPNTKGPKAAPGSGEATKTTSSTLHSAAEYAFLGKNPRSSDADILGVPANASKAQLKKAYSKLALEFHPDKNKAPLAQGAFQIIQSAYERLLAKAPSSAPSAPEKAKEKPQAPKAQPKPSKDNQWDFLPENQRPSAPPAPKPSSTANGSASAPKARTKSSEDDRWDFLPENQRPSAPPAPKPSAADVAPSAPSLNSLPQNKGPAAPGW